MITFIMSFLNALVWFGFLNLIFFYDLIFLMQNLALYFLFVIYMKIIFCNIVNIWVWRRNSIFNLKVTALFFWWLATIGQNIICPSKIIIQIILLYIFLLTVHGYRLKILIFNHGLSNFFAYFIKTSLARHYFIFLYFVCIFITV